MAVHRPVEAGADPPSDAPENVEESGHIPQLEQPDRFTDAGRAFIDAL